MNIEKIGKFILELRKSKNLTQEELAELIPIGRGAVSKWERGVTIPDSSTLLKLSEIFNVTINEILCGQKLTKKEELTSSQSITLSLYDSNYKRKRIIVCLIAAILMLFLFFFTYYFINSYKSIKVYTISGIQENKKLYDGIFVNTKNKLYFRLELAEEFKDEEINKITLYYLSKDKEEHEICSSDDSNIQFIDYYGYNEYLESDKIDYIIQNLYLKIIYYGDDKTDIIKLDLKEDYINDNLFFMKSKKVIEKENVELLPTDLGIFAEKIKKCFEFKDDNYILEEKKNNSIKSYIYIPDSQNLYFSIIKDKSVIEEWSFDFINEELTYTSFSDNFSFSFKNSSFNCLNGECYNEKEKVQFFWEELYRNLE